MEEVELEITENRLMQNLTKALDVLTRFRLMGFGLSKEMIELMDGSIDFTSHPQGSCFNITLPLYHFPNSA